MGTARYLSELPQLPEQPTFWTIYFVLRAFHEITHLNLVTCADRETEAQGGQGKHPKSHSACSQESHLGRPAQVLTHDYHTPPTLQGHPLPLSQGRAGDLH